MTSVLERNRERLFPFLELFGLGGDLEAVKNRGFFFARVTDSTM